MATSIHNAKKVSVSLSPELLALADKKGRAEQRTRSEVLREALRAYLLPTYEPTAKEWAALATARTEKAVTKIDSLSDLNDALGLTA